MKYVFFGTPEFAAIILGKLIASGFPPVAVVCNPDRPAGRRKIITPPPTKVIAKQNGVRVLQPEKPAVNDIVGLGQLDFAVVAAYARIIPLEIIKLPRLGTIGVHPSLLPKHRGSSPIQQTILDGDAETGVTLYLLDEKVDHGHILENRKWKIEKGMTYLELQKQLAELGGDLLTEIIPKFLAGKIKPQIQNEADATFTKKFKTEDGFVSEKDLEEAIKNGGEKAAVIDRKIRALNPEPGIWTIKNGKRLKLLEAEIKESRLALKTIQEEGGKPRHLTD